MNDNIQDILLKGEEIVWIRKPNKFLFTWMTLFEAFPMTIGVLILDIF